MTVTDGSSSARWMDEACGVLAFAWGAWVGAHYTHARAGLDRHNCVSIDTADQSWVVHERCPPCTAATTIDLRVAAADTLACLRRSLDDSFFDPGCRRSRAGGVKRRVHVWCRGRHACPNAAVGTKKQQQQNHHQQPRCQERQR